MPFANAVVSVPAAGVALVSGLVMVLRKGRGGNGERVVGLGGGAAVGVVLAVALLVGWPQPDDSGSLTDEQIAALPTVDMTQLQVLPGPVAGRSGTAGGVPVSPSYRVDAAVAAQHVTRALETLLTAHGSSGFADASPLQRIWRDATVAARHGMLIPHVNLELYGAALVGAENTVSPFV